MKFYTSAALPMLCYDDKTLYDFVEYFTSCKKPPEPEEVSAATGIPIEICYEKLPLVLRLNAYLNRYNYKKPRRIKRIAYFLSD
jgi:hypothetical protein